MNTRFHDKNNEVRYVHTLNGSGVALARTVLCLIENCQTAEGFREENLPKALQPYLRPPV